MSQQVRQLPASDIGAWASQMGVGFHYQVPDKYPEYLLTTIDLERTWAGYDGERVVGTLRSAANTITVPGCTLVPAAALTNVTVAPTHRRRGILTEMITSDLKASKEKGDVVGILIASEWPIYGRYGYGPAIYGAHYEIDTRALSWRAPSVGTVELVDVGVFRKEAQGLFEAWRTTQVGAIGREDHWWDRNLRIVEVPGVEPSHQIYGLYRGPGGELEGYLNYTTKSDWDAMRPQGTLTLKELVSLTPRAAHTMFDYCCSVDLLTAVDASNRAIDEALELLLADGRHVKTTAKFDFVWVRILDVVAALQARTYAASGSVVLEIEDAIGLAGGRYRLEAGSDGAACEPTTAEADIVMPIGSLGAVYLSGQSFARLQAAGRLTEHSPGAVAKVDSMFMSGRAPWCNTWF